MVLVAQNMALGDYMEVVVRSPLVKYAFPLQGLE